MTDVAQALLDAEIQRVMDAAPRSDFVRIPIHVAAECRRAIASTADLQARLERYYDALVQADLKIRSFPGTDQSDVEFIRQATARNTEGNEA